MKISTWLYQNRWREFTFLWLLFFIVAVLVRLPQFLSTNFWFDGDEAIIGIMAQDLLAGRSFPLYFYGQDYGLSIFEVCSVALWLKILGTGVLALRLGGLTLFAIGIVFLWKGLTKRNLPFNYALMFCLLVLIFPTWIAWGSFVRGGYVTGFAAACALFYVSSLKKKTGWNVLATAICLTLVFDAHNFIILPILPLLLRDWMKAKGTFIWFVFGLFLAIVFYCLLHSFNYNASRWYPPRPNFDFEFYAERYLEYVNGWIHIFTNFFYYDILLDLPKTAKIAAIGSCTLIIIAVVRLVKKSDYQDRLFIGLWCFCMLGLFALMPIFSNFSPRYLISFFTGFIFLFAFYSSPKSIGASNQKESFLIGAFFLLNIVATPRLERDFYFSDQNEIKLFHQLYEEVKKQKIEGVFVTSNFIQWQWNYLFGQEIPANSFRSAERTMFFTKAVESIYKSSPEKTAIIGNWGIFYDLDQLPGFNDSRQQVAEKYFIQPIVSREFHEAGYLKMSGKLD